MTGQDPEDQEPPEPPESTRAAFEIFAKFEELAEMADHESRKKHEGQENSLVRDAHFVLAHDSMCIYRSIMECCAAGWSPSGAILCRTLLDLVISTTAIARSTNPELAAFKYLYYSFRATMRDQTMPTDARAHARQTCKDRLSMLEEEPRSQALRFLHKEKNQAYWFQPEFRSPTEVLERFARADIKESYHRLSAAAHGGYLGLRTFRDAPDDFSMKARAPKRAAEFVLVMAARTFAEQTRLRIQQEDLPLLDDYRSRYEEARQMVERYFARY